MIIMQLNYIITKFLHHEPSRHSVNGFLNSMISTLAKSSNTVRMSIWNKYLELPKEQGTLRFDPVFHHSSKISGIWQNCKPLWQTTVSLTATFWPFFFFPRNISGLMDGGAYMCETGSWSDTPRCAADSRQNLVAVFSPGEGEITKRTDVRFCLTSYQGNQWRGRPFMPLLIKTIISWGLGQVLRKVSQMQTV